jgi:hypothetical protein
MFTYFRAARKGARNLPGLLEVNGERVNGEPIRHPSSSTAFRQLGNSTKSNFEVKFVEGSEEALEHWPRRSVFSPAYFLAVVSSRRNNFVKEGSNEYA